MFSTRGRRSVPQLNTTSTADISFILLVFFLVMTSMDADKGLSRTLPPMPADEQQHTAEVEKGNVLRIEITASGRLLADGQPIEPGRLRRRVTSFVSNSTDRSRHLITLDVDRKAPYEAYFIVQNEITAAYNALRDGYAVRTYGRAYALCTPGQRDTVRSVYPQRIAETAAAGQEGGAQ